MEEKSGLSRPRDGVLTRGTCRDRSSGKASWRRWDWEIGKNRQGQREGVFAVGRTTPAKCGSGDTETADLYTRGRKTRLRPIGKALNPGRVHRPVPLVIGQGQVVGAGDPADHVCCHPTGARTPALPARCLGGRCQPQCLCVCVLSTGAACMATSPSGTCRTRSSRPSVPAAALSGETQPPAPRRVSLSGATAGLMGLAVPTAVAGPSRWLVSVSTWCRMYPWLCTTLAGSPR